MATSTERFGFTLPSGQDPASIIPLNLNTQNIEKYLGMTQDMLAPLYDATAGTYEVDDIVTHDSVLYKCITAVETPEEFDETKWVPTTAVSEGGGGAGAIEKTQAEYNSLTPAQKANGSIYMVQGESGSVIPFDMTNIVKYTESNVDVTSSQDNTTFTWDGGSLIGMTMYYTQKVDLTNAHTVSYSLTTGTCYGGNPLRNFAVGVCETAPSAVTAHSNINYAVHNVYDDSDASSQFSNETLDVSGLTGEYYIVVTGFGWNATLSNITTVEAEESVNKIYYMGTEYANTNGGSGGGGNASLKATVLYDTPITANGTYMLADSYENYDFISIKAGNGSNEADVHTYAVDDLKRAMSESKVITNPNTGGRFNFTISTNTITIPNKSISTIYSVIGYKIVGGGGSGSSVEYSIDEHKVGTWIDGRDVYEKTIYKDAINGKGNFLIANYPTKNDIDFFAVQDVSYIVNNSYINGIGINLETGANAQGVFLDNNNAPSGFPTNFTNIYVTVRYVKKAVS